jgi:hypothetical protein
LNKGSIANTYFKNTNALGTPSGTNTISTYTSSIASIIQVICQKYGTSPLTTSEIDLSSFNSFNTKAPAGIYLTSNTNTIQVCQELADSIGAQFTCSRSGAVKLVRLEEPQSSTTTITDEYILDRSLRLEEKLPVKGAIKLAYCKNWTVQNQLLTGIPEAHKMLLGMEYLYKVVQDTPTLITYNLSGEPTTKNTLLVSNTPESYVTTEATRILNLWKVPRFIYRMDLPSKYLNLDIGQMVVITHGRFGLTGVSAQIVSVQTSWDTGKITIGIMV